MDSGRFIHGWALQALSKNMADDATPLRRYVQHPIAGACFKVDERYTGLKAVGGGSYRLIGRILFDRSSL